MRLLRANPNGGRTIKEGEFPFHSDKQGNMGFLLGYIDKNIIEGDKILIPMSLAKEFASQFWQELETYQAITQKKRTFKEKMIIMLGGAVEN